jgi:gas vesicle protein
MQNKSILSPAMFNSNSSSTDTRIAVLEERLSSYEVMLNRIDEAIQMMSTTSQNISKMLTIHDQKIEQCGKTDEMITSMIGELKSENQEQHTKVSDRIKSLETKVEEMAKFRWILVGIAVVVSFAFSQSSVVVDILTPDQPPAKIRGYDSRL